MRNFRSGFAPLAIVAVIAGVLILGGATYFGARNFSPVIPNYPVPQDVTTVAPIAQSDSTDTSTWKTYRNEKYGFEFKYPQSMTIPSGDDWNPVRSAAAEGSSGDIGMPNWRSNSDGKYRYPIYFGLMCRNYRDDGEARSFYRTTEGKDKIITVAGESIVIHADPPRDSGGHESYDSYENYEVHVYICGNARPNFQCLTFLSNDFDDELLKLIESVRFTKDINSWGNLRNCAAG